MEKRKGDQNNCQIYYLTDNDLYFTKSHFDGSV